MKAKTLLHCVRMALRPTWLASNITYVGLLGSSYAYFYCLHVNFRPFPRNVLVRKPPGGLTDSCIVLDKSRAVCSHAKEATKFLYCFDGVLF